MGSESNFATYNGDQGKKKKGISGMIDNSGESQNAGFSLSQLCSYMSVIISTRLHQVFRQLKFRSRIQRPFAVRLQFQNLRMVFHQRRMMRHADNRGGSRGELLV